MRRAPSFDDAQKGRGRDGDGETATEGTGLDDQSDAAAGPGLQPPPPEPGAARSGFRCGVSAGSTRPTRRNPGPRNCEGTPRTGLLL